MMVSAAVTERSAESAEGGGIDCHEIDEVDFEWLGDNVEIAIPAVAEATPANVECNAQDGLIESAADNELEDGDDLFPGSFAAAKRTGTPLSSTTGPLHLRTNTNTTSTDNDKVLLPPAAPTSAKHSIVSDSSSCSGPVLEVSERGHRALAAVPRPVSFIDGPQEFSNFRRPSKLEVAEVACDALAGTVSNTDNCDDSMEEEDRVEKQQEHNIQEAQEHNSKGDYSDLIEEDDNDALSTTNHDGDMHSTTTTSSMNVQEDGDYEMGGLYSATSSLEPRRSAVASLTPESSRCSPVLHSMDDHEDEQQLDVRPAKNNEKIGRVGLSNLGNTCFMNSTIQCLAHTDMLREYFTSERYKEHLNVDNPLGTGGELATEFATLLSQMWSEIESSNESSSPPSYLSPSYRYASSYGPNVVYPRNFKYALGKHAEQFMGYDQHDSQELATYLLDALHEDTNQVTKKPYVEKPEQAPNESDYEAAAKAWNIHLQREDSFVTRTFVGQVKSKVTCPVQNCGRVSTTYDPFMYLSVPIPGTLDRTIHITFVPLDPAMRNTKIAVRVPKSASVGTLLERLEDIINVAKEDLIAADIFKNEVFAQFDPKDLLGKIRDTDDIYVYQLEPLSSIHRKQMIEESCVASKFSDQINRTDSFYSCESRKAAPDEDEKKHCISSLSDETMLPAKTQQHYDDEDEWTRVLCHHTSELSFHRLHNTKRSTHQERMEFLAKLQTYVIREKNRFQKGVQDIGTLTPDTRGAAFAPSTTGVGIFHGTECLEDALILQHCGEKFRQWCMEVQEEKQKSLKDGVIIQVWLGDNSMEGTFTSRSSKTYFTIPFIMRIPCNMTVYELRVAIGKRLSKALVAKDLYSGMSHETFHVDTDHDVSYHNGHESTKKPKFSIESDLKPVDFPTAVMSGIPLTYQNTNHSNYTKAHRLGCLELESYPTQQQQQHTATADNTDEAVVVSDLLGRDSGRVYLNFSLRQRVDYRFNVDRWEVVETFAPGAESNDIVSSYGINLLSCIEKYCQKEQLEESEMWYCNRCKAHVRAWKHIHLYRAPPILIVHLKRFHYASSTHRREKIDVHVDFPLKGLDLTSYVSHWENGEEPIYDCFAVSNHYGGLGGGHYTAYALNHGKWCHFDDSVVTEDVSESDVVSNAAYVLYYRRRKESTASNAADERMVLDNEMQSYSFPPVSITTDTSSRGSLDELFDSSYQNDVNTFTV